MSSLCGGWRGVSLKFSKNSYRTCTGGFPGLFFFFFSPYRLHQILKGAHDPTIVRTKEDPGPAASLCMICGEGRGASV